MNMARIATVDAMVEAIRESDQPALSKQGIADHVGVSWQTINNHEHELEDDPRVESGQVGKSKIFWLEEGENPDADAIDTHDTPTERQTGDETGDESSGGGTEAETTASANDDGSWADVRRDRRQPPDGVVGDEQAGGSDEDQAEGNTWVAGLASRSVVVRAAAVILVGYAHLIPAHFAAVGGFSTVAVGLLILTTVFAAGGLLLLFASVVANAALAITANADTNTRFTDGGAEA